LSHTPSFFLLASIYEYQTNGHGDIKKKKKTNNRESFIIILNIVQSICIKEIVVQIRLKLYKEIEEQGR
jgi:hypothetical protein